ncbi:hypothetical protein ES708_19626 [subsurface metagenome]
MFGGGSSLVFSQVQLPEHHFGYLADLGQGVAGALALADEEHVGAPSQVADNAYAKNALFIARLPAAGVHNPESDGFFLHHRLADNLRRVLGDEGDKLFAQLSHFFDGDGLDVRVKDVNGGVGGGGGKLELRLGAEAGGF